MAFWLLVIGVVIIVAAIRNSQGALFTAIKTDVPDFVVWAAAIIAIGAIGYVPGLKPVSRGLLALIIIVLILRNYSNIIAGFKAASTQTSGTGGTAASGSTSGSEPAAPANPLTQFYNGGALAS